MKDIDNARAPNIFTKADPSFQTLHQTMDSVYKELRVSGVGSHKHSAEVFTKHEEN